ncbi:MAG: dihydroxy-acid dehydratase, partial [Candidatus Poribacteria bacterium]
MIQAHQFDAVVMICSCDKIIPGMLMSALRCDIPTIFLTGGTMLPHGSMVACDVKEAIGAYKSQKITKQELEYIEENACASPGLCSMMGTASTMSCIVEALGLSMPGCAVMPAVSSAKLASARLVGKQIMKILKNGLAPSQIVTKASIINAIKVGMSIGGSTNMLLHIPAIAKEIRIDIPLSLFDEISKKTPLLAKFKPASNYNLLDFYQAGGVPAIMKAMESLLDLDLMTVT